MIPAPVVVAGASGVVAVTGGARGSVARLPRIPPLRDAEPSVVAGGCRPPDSEAGAEEDDGRNCRSRDPHPGAPPEGTRGRHGDGGGGRLRGGLRRGGNAVRVVGGCHAATLAGGLQGSA